MSGQWSKDVMVLNWKRFWWRPWSRAKIPIFALLASFGGLFFVYDARILSLILSTAAKDWDVTVNSQFLLSGTLFLGAILGAVFVGKFTDLVGRRDIITTSASCYAFSSFACTAAIRFEELLIERLLLGIIGELTSLVVSLYFAGISHARHRGHGSAQSNEHYIWNCGGRCRGKQCVDHLGQCKQSLYNRWHSGSFVSVGGIRE